VILTLSAAGSVSHAIHVYSSHRARRRAHKTDHWLALEQLGRYADGSHLRSWRTISRGLSASRLVISDNEDSFAYLPEGAPMVPSGLIRFSSSGAGHKCGRLCYGQRPEYCWIVCDGNLNHWHRLVSRVNGRKAWENSGVYSTGMRNKAS